MSRLAAMLLAAVAALLAGGTGALAHWSASGSGAGTSQTATLRPAIVRAEASGATVTLTWVSDAGLEGDPGAPVAYEVLRKGPGDDAYAPVAQGGCAAPMARPASSCEDAVPTGGAYRYRVVAVHRTWTAVSDAGEVSVASPAETTDPGPGAGGVSEGPAAEPPDAAPPEHGAAAVTLAADADGWIDAASVADVAVAVDMEGPASAGDQVIVELRDRDGVSVTGTKSVPEGATSVVVDGIDAGALAETSSSVGDPAAAREVTLTARVVDLAGNANPVVASGRAGKDVTAPPATGVHGLAVRLEPAGDGAQLVGTAEPFDAISAVPVSGEAPAVSGTVSADGVISPVRLGWPIDAGARVTATDPAGNALTIEVPSPVEQAPAG